MSEFSHWCELNSVFWSFGRKTKKGEQCEITCVFLSIKARKPLLVGTQNKTMNLKMSITCLLCQSSTLLCRISERRPEASLTSVCVFHSSVSWSAVSGGGGGHQTVRGNQSRVLGGVCQVRWESRTREHEHIMLFILCVISSLSH